MLGPVVSTGKEEAVEEAQMVEGKTFR